MQKMKAQTARLPEKTASSRLTDTILCAAVIVECRAFWRDRHPETGLPQVSKT